MSGWLYKEVPLYNTLLVPLGELSEVLDAQQSCNITQHYATHSLNLALIHSQFIPILTKLLPFPLPLSPPPPRQIMDREGGRRAIEGLDGNQLTGSPKPLSVQPYVSHTPCPTPFSTCNFTLQKVSSIQSPEQTDLDNLPSNVCTRVSKVFLFGPNSCVLIAVS